MNMELPSRLHRLSEKVPKERIVLFFGREEFSDNTKYLYLKALEQKGNFRCIWCSCQETLIAELQKKGLPCQLISQDTLSETIRLFLSAAVAVFSVNPSQSLNGSEELFSCLQGARQIQLWHGVSVKHLLLELVQHLDVGDYDFRRPLDFASRADCVVSTSPHLDAFFRRAFGCKRIIRAGYPRNEVLVRPATKNEYIGADIPGSILSELLNPQRKKVFFAPTWQRSENTLLTNSMAFITQLAKACKVNNASLFIKSHPLYINDQECKALSQNCFYINPGLDLYPVMRHFDVLVTDYSSIMFDFLLTGKPVMRLDFNGQTHRSFEPDFTLVPDVDFAWLFTDENVEEVLNNALYRDDKQALRKKMVDLLFPGDNADACSGLINLLNSEVDSVMENNAYYSVEEYDG
ncbi:TPA: CDP-glycerol glycerophosphotransferase family protein [Enterobacter cloacae]|nr:CDP-glycerol glycerophosphotransferase family protein [Enterobacter pasteurii]